MSENQSIQRFDFFRLQDFSSDHTPEPILIEPLEIIETPPPPPPSPTFSEAEMEKAKKEAYQQGFADGQTQGRDEQLQQKIIADKDLQQQNRLLADKLASVRQVMQEQMEAQHQELLALASGIAVKLAEHALKEHYMEVIESMLRYSLPQLLAIPHLTVRVQPESLENTQSLLEKICAEQGYEGGVSVVTDASLRAGDVRIDWQSGSASRSFQTLLNQLQAVLPIVETPNVVSLAEEEHTPELDQLQAKVQSLLSRKSLS